MERLNPIRSANCDLHDFACGRIQLHFPITFQDEFRDPFGGSDVDSLDIGPIERFETLVRSDFFQHVTKGNAWYFSGPLLFWRLNPGPLLFDLQQ